MTRIVNRSVHALLLSFLFAATLTAARADTTLYSNGPTNGTYDSWFLTTTLQVQNSFVLTSPSTLTGVTFGNWLLPGVTASTVDWAIVTTEGTQTLACGGCSGTASLTAAGTPVLNGLDYDVDDQSFSLPDISLGAGTYWLELQNEVTSGFPGSWDMNGGPSMIWDSFEGDQSGDNCNGAGGPGRCSDAFTITGTTVQATPEPSSLALLGSGLTLVATQIRRRRSCR